MRISIFIILLLVIVGTVEGLEECKKIAEPKDIPCMVMITWSQPNACSTYQATIYNETGMNLSKITLGNFGDTGLCSFNFTYNQSGSYPYNVTTGDTGNIIVEVDDKVMSFGIMIFLMGLNIIIFILPFIVKKFHESESANYVIRKLVFIGSIILLWFNMTIFRSMAEDFRLGIDEFLLPLWWFLTIGMFILVFVMAYVMVVGSMKLMKEAQLKKRMGMDDGDNY